MKGQFLLSIKDTQTTYITKRKNWMHTLELILSSLRMMS